MTKEEYEKELAERQRQHLENVFRPNTYPWKPCLHDACPDCHGTGVRAGGGFCTHGISCDCPKCTTTC